MFICKYGLKLSLLISVNYSSIAQCEERKAGVHIYGTSECFSGLGKYLELCFTSIGNRN